MRLHFRRPTLVLVVSLLSVLPALGLGPCMADDSSVRVAGASPSGQALRRVYLPVASKGFDCHIPGESYSTLSVESVTTPGAIERNPDLNITVRGWAATNQYKGLVDYHNPADSRTPQFPDLFADRRAPTFTSVYQMHDWDWGRMTPGPLISNPPVSLLGLGTRAGETIHVPDSGYTIGSGCEVLVLYAAPDRITLKYTREDHVVYGYTFHVEGICVEPDLLALYQSCAAAGRRLLPALRPRQAFGRARGSEILIAIRDCGTFLDPRSHFDWWRGR